MIQNVAKRYSLPIIYVNQVGGNDSLIFDGGSFVLDEKGRLIARAKRFEEDFVVVDLDKIPVRNSPLKKMNWHRSTRPSC